MTSQKRYRHHQDNNSSRYRDLPPRFKRQKSSTSPTPQSSESQATQASSTSKTSQVSKTTKRTEPPQLAMSPVPITSSSAVYNDTPGAQERVRSDVFQTPQPVAPDAMWAWPVTCTDNMTVLSEADNRVSRIHSPVSHVALGTHFGYRTTSPPMSPWPAAGVTNIIQPQGISRNSVWSPPLQSDPFKSQNLISPPGFYNNENQAPHGLLKLTPGSQWGKPTFTAMQNQNLPSTSTQSLPSSSLPDRLSGKPRVSPEEKKNDVKRDIDYSDPDIRTIEMLRELERVADQKEAESDDFGADRKSLVSHHLRMLMCAVDRYTEGLEDEIALTSRTDEVTQETDSPASTPAPSPSKVWQQGQTDGVKNGVSPVPSPAPWSVNSSSPEWARGPIVSPNRCDVFSSPSPVKLEFPSPQPSPSGKGQNIQTTKEAPAWDLWSSPSFDFCGVLTRQGLN